MNWKEIKYGHILLVVYKLRLKQRQQNFHEVTKKYGDWGQKSGPKSRGVSTFRIV